MKCKVYLLVWLLSLIYTSLLQATDTFTHRFGGDRFDNRLLKYVGAHSSSAIQETSRGLVIKLPVDKPGRPQVGVSPKFNIYGDFDITLDYQILEVEQPDKGYGTGVTLRLFKQEGEVRRVNFSHFTRRNGKQIFGTNYWTPGEEKLKRHPESFPVETETKRGRLRLKRTGSNLSFLVPEGHSHHFRELRIIDFGPEPLKAVQMLADTGGSEKPLTVCLTNLSIQSDRLPYQKSFTGESAWSIWSMLGLAGALLVISSGIWYWKH